MRSLPHTVSMVNRYRGSRRKNPALLPGHRPHLLVFNPAALGAVNAGVWKQLHGTDFCGEPTAECLWQALYEMGIYANLSVEPGCEPGILHYH